MLSLPEITPQQCTQAFRHGIFVHIGDAMEFTQAVGLRAPESVLRAERKPMAKKIETDQHPMLTCFISSTA